MNFNINHYISLWSNNLGQSYGISCKKCGASTEVSEGHGRRYSQNFENLFLNFMDESERISFSRKVPDGSSNHIDRCKFSVQPLRCSKCLLISSLLVWSIAFKNGWTYSPPLRCECCRDDLKTFSFPLQGEFKSQCWKCENDTLSVKLSAMWN